VRCFVQDLRNQVLISFFKIEIFSLAMHFFIDFISRDLRLANFLKKYAGFLCLKCFTFLSVQKRDVTIFLCTVFFSLVEMLILTIRR